MPAATAHLAHHDQPGVDAHPHREVDTFVPDQRRIERSYGL